MIDFKGHRIEKDIILTCVRWYLAYPLSYRNLEEMMAERGVEVDHSNVYRWVQKFTPQLETVFRKGPKRPVGRSWRMDEASITIKGQWKYHYRTSDKEGQTLDFFLAAHRDKKATLHFFMKAVRQHGLPDKVTIDKSGANTAALEALAEETGAEIEIRQIKSFRSARITLAGIKLMPKKSPRLTGKGLALPLLTRSITWPPKCTCQ